MITNDNRPAAPFGAFLCANRDRARTGHIERSASRPALTPSGQRLTHPGASWRGEPFPTPAPALSRPHKIRHPVTRPAHPARPGPACPACFLPVSRQPPAGVNLGSVNQRPPVFGLFGDAGPAECVAFVACEIAASPAPHNPRASAAPYPRPVLTGRQTLPTLPQLAHPVSQPRRRASVWPLSARPAPSPSPAGAL